MKFDYVIGNPPYQESIENTSDKPVYNEFMNSAYKIGDIVELITPARFLFNAGKTPKDWNDKMLNDEHFKVLKYVSDGKEVFSNTDIKGGVAIHFYNKKASFIPISIFTPYEQLNSILSKIIKSKYQSIDEYVYSESSYRYTESFIIDNPEVKHLLTKSSQSFISSNAFAVIPKLFTETKINNTDIEIIGRYDNKRASRYIKRQYIDAPNNFYKYKVFLPKSNGSGVFGETLSSPFIGKPLIGHTQTFISIGCFDIEENANNCLKYIKSKFCRTLLGVLKITQDNKKNVWKYVPFQNFTTNSDIDWSQSIHEIDIQLYKKYGLDDNEINFIETHVKEME